MSFHIAFWNHPSLQLPTFGDPKSLSQDTELFLQSSRTELEDRLIFRLISHAHVALFDVKDVLLSVSSLLLIIIIRHSIDAGREVKPKSSMLCDDSFCI